MIVVRSRPENTPLAITLEANGSGGGYSPVTGSDDVVHTEGAPASGPDTTTGQMRAIVTGGTPPYTYAWIKRSGSARISADNPTGSATTFTIDAGAYGSPVTATYDCEVTDALSATASATQDGQVVFDGGL